MIEDVFLNRLRLLRKRKGITQKELANILGVTQNTISNWESGRQEPSYSKLVLLGKIFNVPLQYFFGTDTKTLEIFEKLKPKIIANITSNGTEYIKNAYKKVYDELQEAERKHKENVNNFEFFKDYTIKSLNYEKFLFQIAIDDLMIIEPDEKEQTYN